MALFAITFRLNTDQRTDRVYQRCYNALTDAIENRTTSTFWKEPTSFYLLTANTRSKALCEAIVSDVADFDESIDLLVVINLDRSAHFHMGTLDDPDFITLMAKRNVAV